jgi:hypothetical protein
MTDVYAPYRALLAGKDVPIHADQPYPGYYKVRSGRDGPWQPCAIWYPSGSDELVCRVGSETRDPVATWTYAAKNPVAKDAARFAFENGYFPDEPKPTSPSNMPADPFEALLAEMTDKSAQADELLAKNPEIKSQQVCDLARNLQAQLLDINKRADAMHKEEKAPILEKERQVEEKFRFRAAVKVLSERLRQRFGAFLAAEERRQQEEARRKFEAERAAAEAERQRLEAERAKQKEDDPIAFHTSPEPELPDLPLAPEPVKVNAGGGFGRKAGLRTDWVPEITDYKLAALHVMEQDDVRAAVEKVITRLVKAAKGKINIPGVTVQTVRRAA